MSHGYCRAEVKLARYKAEEKGIKLPKMSTSKLGQDEYAIFIGSKYFEANGCCVANAKQIAIYEYIDAVSGDEESVSIESDSNKAG